MLFTILSPEKARDNVLLAKLAPFQDDLFELVLVDLPAFQQRLHVAGKERNLNVLCIIFHWLEAMSRDGG